MRTHFLKLTETLMRAQTHTHTPMKSSFDQGSAILIEPHLAGFYGNSRLGWGILWCSAPVVQTDEWTVCSVSCLSQTQLSPSDWVWLGGAVAWQWQPGESSSGYTLEHFIWVYKEQVRVSFPEVLSCVLRGRRAGGWSSGYQLFPTIKSLPLPPVKALASLPALTFWPIMLHCATISSFPFTFGNWHALLYKGAECFSEVETNNKDNEAIVFTACVIGCNVATERKSI